jgi:2-phospho-L-lactate guanylyltransferase
MIYAQRRAPGGRPSVPVQGLYRVTTAGSTAQIDRGLWVLIPLKNAAEAKSRLAAVLAPAARAELVLAMADQVIAAAKSARGVAGVAVVSASPTIAAFARERGVAVITETGDAGMAAACSAAITELIRQGAQRVLILPADLPCADSDAIGVLAAAPGPGIVMVTDRHGEGTNALLLDPPDAIAPAFGADSASAHRAAASAAGIALTAAPVAALQFDLDTVDDLAELAALCAAGDPLTLGLSARLRGLLRETDRSPQAG